MQISKSIDLKKKEVDDVLGGAESWKNAAKTDGMTSLSSLQRVQCFASTHGNLYSALINGSDTATCV